MKTLILIDVMPLLYRGHFAFAGRPRMTALGVNTSALYIFCLLVMQMVREKKATHVALAMDAGPTFRHERFPEYKAQREKMPEDIAASIPMAEAFAAAMRLPFLRLPGYEADDIIGTLARRGEEAGMAVYLFTPDKDFAQLVTPNVTLCRPGKGDAATDDYDVAKVCQAWGLRSPQQMIDLLGLSGDASDNIPGVEGVGEKTAQKLLAEYGDMEAIIARAADIKGKLGEKIAAQAEAARLSRWLAAIDTNAPLAVSLEDLAVAEPDTEAVAGFFKQYELSSLAKRFGQETSPGRTQNTEHRTQNGNGLPPAASDDLPLFAAMGIELQPPDEKLPPEAVHKSKISNLKSKIEDGDQPTAPSNEYRHLADHPHSYTLCDTLEKVDALVEELSRSTGFAFDTETTGLETWKSELVGIGFCTVPGRAWYVPIRGQGVAEGFGMEALRRLSPVFTRKGLLKIGHNLKFDLGVMRHAGIEVAGPFSDTMLAHYVLDPTERHGMDTLAKGLLGYEPIPIESLIGEKGEIAMDQVPLDRLAEYCAEDADVTMRLHAELMPRIAEAGAERVLTECENELIPVILDMEAEGVRLDEGALHRYGAELALEIQELEEKIYEAAGVRFNIASPKQLGHILFERLKLPPAGKTATGQWETSEGVLAGLAGRHEIIDRILEYRLCAKLKGTYVDKLPLCIRPETGRVHTTFNQALTETGRLSSDNPNLQNIPIRTPRGKRIREAFVPRDDNHVLMSADYSQVELRVMAAMSGDASMIAAFKEKADIHLATAAKVFGVAPELVSPAMRSEAKMVNFGIIYGISAFGLSERLGIPRQQAADLIDNYFKQYPAVKAFMDATIVQAREQGYVTTLLGRRRPLRDIASRNGTVRRAAERVAINTPVQGTAADLVKRAMVLIHRELRQRRLAARIILQVHDELVLDVPRHELPEVEAIVRDGMVNALPLAAPLDVDIGSGPHWLAAH
ncbi:MAG: DNA polymerase I [Kiritimatiellaeota bacterium]|nr:DNA polymerase I [Kiritimatiellota bacterium]